MDLSSNTESLPSKIAQEFCSLREKGEKVDSEGTLQLLLSALSQQPDLETLGEDATTLTDSVWELLNSPDIVLDLGDAGNPAYEWKRGLTFAGSLIPDLSPFELHLVASQSITFVETGTALYTATCILLCCVALRQFPVPITSRPKRSRSCLFETIRLFQRLCTEDGLEVFVPLWNRHVIPSCQHVLMALPSDSNDWLWYRAAFVAGSVSTSARIAVALCRTEADQQAKNLDKTKTLILELVQGLEDVLGEQYELAWCHPWRKRSKLNNQGDGYSDLEAALAYWATSNEDSEIGDEDEENREMVAHMETIWDDDGIALLAAVGFETTRRLVSSPEYVWRQWFPHVKILLNCDDYFTAQRFGFDLLKKLLDGTPQHSFTSCDQGVSDSPIGTFQLLSNRILASAKERQQNLSLTAESLPDGSRTFQMMKSLLSKYRPEKQIGIVQLLLRDCPHEGLKPKFIDLLRTYITWEDGEALAKIWEFLGNLIKGLEDQIDTERENVPRLKDPNYVVDRVEVYVAVISLVQLWILVKHCAPPFKTDGLLAMLPNVQAAIRNEREVTATNSSPHEEHHRLDLLDDAISRTADMLSALERS